jgi:hypothetical protein
VAQAASGRRHGNAGRGRPAKLSAGGATVFAKLHVWLERIRSHSFWANVTSPRTIWHGIVFLFGWIYTLIAKLPWVIAVVVVTIIGVQGWTQHATVVNPISVPKDLADRGYTPEVAGQRLRDAISGYSAGAQSHMQVPEIAMHGDLPSIVVPTVGISLDAIISSIRTVLHSTRSGTIGGEITARENHLWLRLRLDGKEIYASKTGADVDKPDDLFAGAVQDVLANIDPVFVAVTLRREDPDRALKFVDEMIAKLPEGNADLPFFYNTAAISIGSARTTRRRPRRCKPPFAWTAV